MDAGWAEPEPSGRVMVWHELRPERQSISGTLKEIKCTGIKRGAQRERGNGVFRGKRLSMSKYNGNKL